MLIQKSGCTAHNICQGLAGARSSQSQASVAQNADVIRGTSRSKVFETLVNKPK